MKGKLLALIALVVILIIILAKRLNVLTKDSSVNIANLDAPIAWALGFANQVYASFGQSMIVTSGNDGEHSSGSLHYSNRAIDIRTKGIARSIVNAIVASLKASLYPKGFDIVLEDVGMDNEHLHIEYDPKDGRVWA